MKDCVISWNSKYTYAREYRGTNGRYTFKRFQFICTRCHRPVTKWFSERESHEFINQHKISVDAQVKY